MSRDLFYFSKGDRRAVILLIALITILNAVRYCIARKDRPAGEIAADSTLTHVVDSVVTPVQNQERTITYQSRRDNPVNSRKRTYSDTLYIIRTESSDDTLQVLPDRWVRKTRPTEPVDLNRADTSELKLLPGIGSYYARRIVEYRDRLGGYVSPGQILDMGIMPDSLVQWFMVTDTIPFRRIKVNTDALATMRNHPYMNFYQARAITDLRKSIGIIKNSARLTLLEEFTEQDLVRLSPYLDFADQ